LTPHHVLILTYWNYQDALVQTYTLPYVKLIAGYLPQGSKIFLITLDKESPGEKDKTLQSLNIQHISLSYKQMGAAAFFVWFKNIFVLRRLIRQENISTVHAWCTPAGMIGYILSRLCGKRLIVDSFEPHAEAMVENKSWSASGIAFKLLFRLEKLQAKHARHLIFAAPGMENYIKEKYNVEAKSWFVKPACVDLEKFNPSFHDSALEAELGLQNKIVGVYAGKFGGIYLEDEVFELIKCCENHWGNEFRFLLLSSVTQEYLQKKCLRYGINPATVVKAFVPYARVHLYMGLAQFAICPVKPVPSKKYCSPIKNGEYWALGLPVIITQNISVDSGIIENHNIGYVLNALTVKEYNLAVTRIEELLKDPGLKEKIRKIAELHRNYTIAEKIYRIIYA